MARFGGAAAVRCFFMRRDRLRHGGFASLSPGWGWPDQADRRAALEALDRLGMASCADADVTQLSGGERQRIAIATLMLQAPQLYLLDEPASHQDVAAQQMLLQLLRVLADDKHAVVASMHDINLGLMSCMLATTACL